MKNVKSNRWLTYCPEKNMHCHQEGDWVKTVQRIVIHQLDTGSLEGR
jgi:hypothetical protein